MMGWSELIFGSMYCGKSEELMRRLKRAKIAGQKYQLFKPIIDNRYGVNHVVTHDSNEAKQEMEKIIDLHITENVNNKRALMAELSKQLSGAMEAQAVKNSRELLKYVDDDTDVIGIDEIQFFDLDLIIVIDELVKRGKRVIMAGLDMYATGEPWGIVPFLASKAKYVDKLHAVCVDCGRDAYISYMIDGNGANKVSKVELGSKDKYIALCECCADKRSKKL